MTTPYEVTYRNMWPSDALNACVREGASDLRDLPAPACRAWFERGAGDSGLKVRLELVAGEKRAEAERKLPAEAEHAEVREVIASTLRTLRVELAARAALPRAA
ncbi:MAG: hypothetical protein JNK82_21955 [Myxococcaceae bacterium]|nr:hypothetical protein [Myxococcaceae bacterium]